jgi:hypothetical protein
METNDIVVFKAATKEQIARRPKHNLNNRDALITTWSPYIESVRNYMRNQGHPLTEDNERNIARCLENSLNRYIE